MMNYAKVFPSLGIRASVMSAVLVWVVLLCAGAGCAVPASGYLVKDGRPVGCIVLSEKENSPKVLTSAKDLAGYIRKMSGANVPVVRDNENYVGFCLFIGSTKAAPVDPAEVSEEKLGYRGFFLRPVPNGLIIAGNSDHGTANGLYYLAEEVLGVHWYSVEDDGPTCPELKTIEIPTLDLKAKPAFPWRAQYLSFQQSAVYVNGTTPLVKALNRNRDLWWTFNRHWGINAECGHAFFSIVPFKLFEAHPEYFPYLDYTFARKNDANEKRVLIPAAADGSLGDAQGSIWPWKTGRHGDDHATQRCLSNPDVLKLAIDWTRKVFDSDPTVRFAALSANDGPWWCNCDACKAMGPTRAHQNLAFANAVAKANEAKYPDKGYVMLAYFDTIEPPVGMKAHRNVVPMIAPLWQCRLHPISSSCPDCIYRRRVITDWQKIAGRTAFYLYNTPGPFTFPGPIALAEEMRFQRDHGGIGGFREHQFTPRVNWQMLAWMEIRLMWDIDQDPFKRRNEFIEGYYGKAAAPAIEKVYDIIEKTVQNTVGDRKWPVDQGDGLHTIAGDELFKPILAKCRADIESAIQTAQTEQPPFQARIIRDMETLLGKNKAEF